MILVGLFIFEEDVFGGKVVVMDGIGFSVVVDLFMKINFFECYGYVYFFNYFIYNFMYC